MNNCVAKLENRKAAGADQIANEFMKYGEKECLPWWSSCIAGYGKTGTWYAPKRWREGAIRGAILNRTYGTYKNLYISLFLLTIVCPIYYGPP